MVEHISIYREAGRFAGWPANYGMWNWDNEIVLVFTLGYHSDDGSFHARDTSKPFATMQARSLDGGKTWQVDNFPGATPGNRALSADEHMAEGMRVGDFLQKENTLLPPPGDIDFTHPDFALMCARTGLEKGVQSFFYVSYDRCKSWQGPYQLPMFGQTGVAARTDYIVEAKDRCLFFFTANKSNGREGKIFCIRTADSGKTFEFVADIGTEPEGEKDFAIMPASLKLHNGRILTALRCCETDQTSKKRQAWIDLYCSDDFGSTWQYFNRPVTFNDLGHNGNPSTLHQLSDNRLVLIYGNRDKPYTIVARLSEDDGETWSHEITLRDKGVNADIGYPRTVVLPDDRVVTAYYFNDRPDGKGERFIEASIWKP